jgi:predicted transcriptional regulator of viral defense system
MPGDAYLRVHEIALDQYGYFTAEQAIKAGVSRSALNNMRVRGTVDRIAHGVYSDTLVPPSPLGSYMAATLWPAGVRGVVSHQTVLALLDLSDVSPDKIHLTVPLEFRVRRTVPKQYILHHDRLEPSEIASFEGIPVTTVARAIRDCHRTNMGPALVRQAIEDAQRTGWLKQREATELEKELLGISR